MQRIKTLAKELGCTIEENPVLARYTTFRIGGKAPLFIDLPISAAGALQKAIQEEGLSSFWIGKGSNLLVSDKGIPSILLHLQSGNTPVINGNTITCEGGTPVIQLCKSAQEHGFAGMEFAFGIPGSIGGGVFMNAGAYGGDMSQVLKSAKVLFPNGNVEIIEAKNLDLGYRHSALMEKEGIVLEAAFTFEQDDPKEIQGRMDEFLRRRKEKQPLEYPSAGSFFRRPTGYFAGGLIEQCGMKGYRVGDAMISDKHAGFMVNCGHATCSEVKAVAKEVRRVVFEQTGVTLEPEVRLIGETWED